MYSVRSFASKGKAGTRRSSTKTCEGYLFFSITSTESHKGLSKNEKKLWNFECQIISKIKEL